MDDIRNQFNEARRDMISAFADLTTLALRAGADHAAITALHGGFFDGNVIAKDAFEVAAFLAEHPGFSKEAH